MDDIVIRGMARWPNVPAVYGWLALDRRGAWLLKGERIANPAVTAFIGRNYLHDERGRWFFQNGPQRVYVDLEYTPLVYRVVTAESGDLVLEAQTGMRSASPTGAWIDDEGALLLVTPLGPGIAHDRDLEQLSACFADSEGHAIGEDELEAKLETLQQGRAAHLKLEAFGGSLDVLPIARRHVENRFGFVGRPREQ
jgi:hypothetical protein